MSEGEGGGDIAATVNEGVDESQAEGKAVTNPIKDEGKGMDHVYPVMSYEKGTDHIEPATSEGKTEYEGKGKGRSNLIPYNSYDSIR